MSEPSDGRHESAAERLDRHWSELLQELRVVQTGVQILTGFLLTVPFQQRFGDLSDAERALYACAVAAAMVATALIVAPVSMHRLMFRRRVRDDLVTASAVLAMIGLSALALAMTLVAALVFQVALGRPAGWIAAAVSLVGFAGLWWMLPLQIRSRARRQTDYAPARDK